MRTRTDFMRILEKSPEEAFKEIADFFAGFKQSQARVPDRVNTDMFYTSNHRLSRLMEADETPTDLYVYDREIWCKGCDSNCGRHYNTLELRRFSKEEAIDDFCGCNKDCPHELTRNLYVGLHFGHELLEIRTWREDYPEKIRLARLQAISGIVNEIKPDYHKNPRINKTNKGVANNKTK